MLRGRAAYHAFHMPGNKKTISNCLLLLLLLHVVVAVAFVQSLVWLLPFIVAVAVVAAATSAVAFGSVDGIAAALGVVAAAVHCC